MSLDKFYYKLEQFIERHSIVSLRDDLSKSEFHLIENTYDPYLQALYAKHGIFSDKNPSLAFQLFSKINDGQIIYEPWDNMHTPIKSFASYHLSVYHLGFDHVVPCDLKMSGSYLDKSAELGNIRALIAQADDILLQESDECNKNKNYNDSVILAKEALSLYIKAYEAGFDEIWHNMIYCYEVLEDYDGILKVYGQRLSICIPSIKTSLLHELRHKIDEYIRKIPESQYAHYYSAYILLLLNTPVHVDVLADAAKFCNAEVVDKLISICKNNSQNGQLLENLLIMFQSNNIFYRMYMERILKESNGTNST